MPNLIVMNAINPTRQFVLMCLCLILATFEGQTRTLAFWSFNSAPETGWTEQIEDDTSSSHLTHNFTKTQPYDGTTVNGPDGTVAGQSFCPQGGTKTENNGAWFAVGIPQCESGVLTLSYAVRRTGTGFTTHQIEYSINGGVDWVFMKLVDISEWANNWEADQVIRADFANLDGMYNNPGFMIRVLLDGSTNSNGNNRIDNLKLEVDDTDLIIEGPLYDFRQVEKGRSSDLQFYYLSVDGLEDEVVVEAPDGFEVSVDCNSGFSSTLRLESSECSRLRIYIRFVPDNARVYKGNIVHSCGESITLLEVQGTGVVSSSDDFYSDDLGRGMDLLFGLHCMINVNRPLSEDQIWDLFKDVDLRFDGSIWDILGPGECKEPAFIFDPVVDSGRNKECYNEGEGYGMFHVWPLAWYDGSDADTVFTDAHLIFPADKIVAARCTRLSLGFVEVCKWASINGCRIGLMQEEGLSDITVLEPSDEYKGDLARAWFYALTRYSHLIPVWCNLGLLPESFSKENQSGLNKAALSLLVKWHRDDPVSQKEILRNNYLGMLQGNRNPFVDQSELVEAVFTELTWTERKNTANRWLVYNLSGDWLYLETDVLQPVSFEIFDSMGRTVKAGLAEGDRIYTGGLPGGIYVVCIRLIGERQCIKLVK